MIDSPHWLRLSTAVMVINNTYDHHHIPYIPYIPYIPV